MSHPQQPVAEAAVGPDGLLELPPGYYDWLRVRLCHPARQETSGVAWLHFADVVDPEFLVATAGSTVAWLPVPRRGVLHSVRLPGQPELAVSSVTPVPSHARTFRPDGGDAHD
ncbi:hypothetical protein [Streptomyces apocyni]|uniref:hypothetical protein n=1 Tax=Streptomyces apocyni TaxID=2654677 RepID=UPI0012EAD806|nr:hypothetical protein [Streptomyces apocyni]